MSEEIIKVQPEKLKQLMKNKLMKAGLKESHADEVANNLLFADLRGVHSHGAVRVEYYSERISKGGTTTDPNFVFERTGPSTGVFHADNGAGHVAAKEGMDEAIALAKETGVGVVGIKRMGHSGTLAYFVEMAAHQDLIALSVCQSDPMVVPFGGRENFFGTNPIAFAAPTLEEPIIFDMATTVQAWGKILDARSKNRPIPDTWAVDANGQSTTDPHQVSGLLPIAGPKGYGLMMMVDILSGTLLGLPFGKHVTSMYNDLTEKRDLGQLHIVIDPQKFTDLNAFKKQLTQMITEIHEIRPAEGFDGVLYPGERSKKVAEKNKAEGIPVAKPIYDYLMSDAIYQKSYDHSDAFAESKS